MVVHVAHNSKHAQHMKDMKNTTAQRQVNTRIHTSVAEICTIQDGQEGCRIESYAKTWCYMTPLRIQVDPNGGRKTRTKPNTERVPSHEQGTTRDHASAADIIQYTPPYPKMDVRVTD